jgi:aminomethyltransferase
MSEKAIPRKDYAIFAEENEIGIVTSGGYSPCLKKGIGIGYVKRGFTKVGTVISILIRGKRASAIVVKPPFYKDGSHR